MLTLTELYLIQTKDIRFAGKKTVSLTILNTFLTKC
nr:MAG TPA: hypothetical protein [Caudoviricetes sp.]